MVLTLRKTKRTFASAESMNRFVDELSLRPTPFGRPEALSRRFEVAYYEAPDMLHVYPLLPIPEAKPARPLIKEILAQRR